MRERPKPGEMWRHYKYDPNTNEVLNEYVYTIIGIGYFKSRNKEDEELCVMYRPLYESRHLKENGGADMYVRPLEIFMEKVQVGGSEVWRFEKVDS